MSHEVCVWAVFASGVVGVLIGGGIALKAVDEVMRKLAKGWPGDQEEQ